MGGFLALIAGALIAGALGVHHSTIGDELKGTASGNPPLVPPTPKPPAPEKWFERSVSEGAGFEPVHALRCSIRSSA